MKDINITFRDENGYCTFGFQKSPEKIEGIEKLVQKVAKNIITTMGSDLFVPSLGGNLTTYITNVGEDEMRANIMMEIDGVMDQMKSIQNKADLPLDEMLADISLIDFSIEKDEMSITILVTSMAGASQLASFPVRLKDNA